MVDKSALKIDEVSAFSITQIAAWPESIGTVAANAARLACSQLAPPPGASASGERGTLLRVGPLEWWLVRTQHELAPALDNDLGAVLDLTASRVWLRLTGAKATLAIESLSTD